jgi:hypothetical protein
MLAGTDPTTGPRRLCEVSAAVTGVDGAGILLMADDVPHGPVCTSDATSAVLERLQFELGEGPGIDACREGRPVLEPDLASPRQPRWVAFADGALEAGVRAVFGFPLQVGAAQIGALNLHRDRPGPLTDDQHADALVMADIVAHAVLALQADAPPGTLAVSLNGSGDLQLVVHQASGMIAAQLEVSVREALVRLRAHAYGNSQSLVAVAQSVVDRELRFETASPDQ